jgi:hypothetical protein
VVTSPPVVIDNPVAPRVVPAVIQPILEPVIFEDFADAAIPLANSYFALPLPSEEGEDDVYQIFDDEGIPLGIILLPEDEAAEEYFEEYFDFDDMIPLANFIFEEVQDKISTEKINPKTSDNMLPMLLIFAVIPSMIITVKKRRAN